MSGGVSSRVLLSLSLTVTVVGLLDAMIGEDWDLFAVFVLSGLLQFALWMRDRASRTPVTLRPDLAHDLMQHAQRTGEPFESVLDRAVAWYQSGLYGRHAGRR